MKEETKKKREHIKNQLLEIEKEVKKEGREKKLSTAQKNKKMLDLLTKKNEEEFEQEIEEVKTKEKVKKFKCVECGIEVAFYGEINSHLIENKVCSKCACI